MFTQKSLSSLSTLGMTQQILPLQVGRMRRKKAVEVLLFNRFALPSPLQMFI